MSYTPEHQYRCTIIRGKSQTDMEDLLPLYANMVHRFCPCAKDAFQNSCYSILAKALFHTLAYDSLPDSNKKTIQNHLTEIAGTLLGLYYHTTDDNGVVYVYESESCKFLVENNDFPAFFKNLCLNFQFPNGAKWVSFIQEDIANNIHIKPFCYVVSLLFYAQTQKVLLTKQEIGYYVLNNLDVLQGNIEPAIVYNRIITDRKNKVKRNKLSGSKEWQHIKEQFNLLALANIIEEDNEYIWLNPQEEKAILLFNKKRNDFIFDHTKFPLNTNSKEYLEEWQYKFGQVDQNILSLQTDFTGGLLAGKDQLTAERSAIKSTTDLGDEGEALVFQIEKERIQAYKPRLVNKVLLLGKTKGLGYDVSSIEADENPQKPEFARYIEVKSTTRVTEPSFDENWSDALNITAKEWIAAEQYGEFYNIYRVYFTKKKTFIVRIHNPFKKFTENQIEVFPTIYQLNFDASVIEQRYAK